MLTAILAFAAYKFKKIESDFADICMILMVPSIVMDALIMLVAISGLVT